MSRRQVVRRVRGRPTSDGAGVRLTRVIGTPDLSLLDPFLMLDEFGSEDGTDYIAGFPEHPHRGFETVTLMLNGSMRHRDSLGNSGHLRDGSAQWMTAGRGIIHSEMPDQTEGLMRGFQLWVNLPAARKMCAPRYQDIAPEQIPLCQLNCASIRVVAGQVGTTRGPIESDDTQPLLLDLEVTAVGEVQLAIPPAHNTFVYCYEGLIEIGESSMEAGVLAVLGPGEELSLNGAPGSRVLIGAGKPLGEPVARWGPFVMNTEAEIRQAISDYQNGQLVQD